MQLWSRLIEKCGLHRANKVKKKKKKKKNQYFRANNSHVTGQILLIFELIRDLMPINTLCNFGLDWLRNQVSITLTRSKIAQFSIFQGQKTSVLLVDFAHYSNDPRSCACKYFVQFLSRLIEKCGRITLIWLNTTIFNLSGSVILELLGGFSSLSNLFEILWL